MRKTIIAGNWKMNHTGKDMRETITALAQSLTASVKTEIVVAPVFPYLAEAVTLAKGTPIHIAAQNMHWLDNGAYTGEVAPAMLVDIGVTHVIIGHSERREYNNETDETVRLKVKSALDHGLTPILCCGETLEQRDAGIMQSWVEGQIEKALAGLTAEEMLHVVIAYEPIWAIGTGKSASQDDAQKMCKVVRDVVAADFGQEVADKVRVQYGGSVKPENVAEYMACPDVDGALVGGASLDPESFLALLDFVK